MKSTTKTKGKPVILPVNTSPVNPKEKMKSKAPQTERKLSNLLEKIRSKSCIRGSAKSSSKTIKKLQVKYERFDYISKTYKLVRQKEGGGPRFTDVYTEDTILFKNIRAKVVRHFFDNENCNYFVEELHECDIIGQQLHENECLWDYLKRKGIILSRTTLVLRSCIETLFHLSYKEENIEDLAYQFNSDDLLDEEDLPPLPFPELGSNVLDGSRVSFASKRKLCGTCSSTYTEDECLKCKQDIEFQSALQQDQNLISFVDSLLTQPPNSPLPPLLIEEPVTRDKIRERRIQYFDNESATPVDVNDNNEIIRTNRMKVREDMIKNFLTEEVCIFQIMLMVIALLAFIFIS